MRKLRFAIIGCGRISYTHIQAIINNTDTAQLTALCDILPERAQEKALIYKKAKIDCKQPAIYKDYLQMLVQEDIDAVAIATESGEHAKIAMQCMAAGKHVIVEKPMALSTFDADEMIACAQKNQVMLCVAHQNRFNPTILKLRAALEQGRFGRVFAANARVLWNRDKHYYDQAAWRGTYAQDGGCLMNQCIHNIDLLQWLLGGDIAEVQAMLGNYLHPYIEAEDYGSIQLRFTNGIIGNVEGTVGVYPSNLEETLTILGEKGTVVIGGLALNKVLTWQFADNLDSLTEIQQECNKDIDNVYGTGHTPLYADFIDSIYHNREPIVNGESGKVAMSIILHAYLANEEKRRVSFGNCNISTHDFAV